MKKLDSNQAELAGTDEIDFIENDFEKFKRITDLIQGNRSR